MASEDDDFERVNEMIRRDPERFVKVPGNRISRYGRGLYEVDEFGMEQLPPLGRYEADGDTKEALREIHPQWGEAFLCAQQAKGRFLAAPDSEAALDNHHRAWSLLRKIEGRAARLALLSASVILPGEPSPETLAAPARVDIGGRWSVVVSPPAYIGGRLKVHFFYGLE